jgi:hypothetical protein
MKEGSGNGATLSVEALWGEPGGRACLLGTLKDMLRSKALAMGVCFHKGLILGNVGGRFFPRAFERRVKFLLSGERLWVTWETCYRRLWKWATLSIRAPTGEPGVSLFSGTFERQMEGSRNGASLINLIWAPFWTQIMLGVWIWGLSGTSLKYQGSHDLVLEYGVQRARFKVYVHWDRKDSNPITILF